MNKAKEPSSRNKIVKAWRRLEGSYSWARNKGDGGGKTELS